MKKIILIGLITLSCNTPIKKEETPTIDSTYSVKVLNEIKAARAELSLTVVDASVKQQLSVTLKQLDTLQNQVKDLQLDKINLIIVESKLKKIKIENTNLFQKIAELKSINSTLKDSNESIKERLGFKTSENSQLIAYNKELKKSLQLAVVGVTIKAYTHSKSFLRKAKLEETLLAKNTEYIEIKFIITENHIIKKGMYPLVFTLYGVGEGKTTAKKLEVDYDNMEIAGSIIFNDIKDFQVGWHKVEISLDKKILHTGSINLN